MSYSSSRASPTASRGPRLEKAALKTKQVLVQRNSSSQAGRYGGRYPLGYMTRLAGDGPGALLPIERGVCTVALASERERSAPKGSGALFSWVAPRLGFATGGVTTSRPNRPRAMHRPKAWHR